MKPTEKTTKVYDDKRCDFSGDISGLKIILKEEFGLMPDNPQLENIYTSLTGFIDSLVDTDS